MGEPGITWDTAESLCAEPYLTRAQAQAMARKLREAGWRVVESDAGKLRGFGTAQVASVYHPATGDSPGDLRTVQR